MRHRRNPIPEDLRYPRSGFLDEFDDTPPTRQDLAVQDRNCDNETYENLDLRHINFYEASLVNTKFINCDLQGCGFIDANCENATFKECDLRNSLFRFTRLNGSNFELSDLRDASLMYAEMLNLEAFDRANIEGTKFTNVALFFAYLRYRKGKLLDLNSIGVPQFEELRLSNSDLQGADLKGMVIRYSYFVRANLQGANLSQANLSGTYLTYANLSGANLSGANLRASNLTHANLSGANLSEADLRYADLISANLSGANLSEADLRYANLIGANLIGANLSGATYNKKTKGLTQSQKDVMIEVV